MVYHNACPQASPVAGTKFLLYVLMWALVKLSANDERLLDIAAKQAVMEMNTSTCTSQDVLRITWPLATLGIIDAELLQRIAVRAIVHVKEFRLQTFVCLHGDLRLLR